MEKIRAELALFFVEKRCALHLTSFYCPHSYNKQGHHRVANGRSGENDHIPFNYFTAPSLSKGYVCVENPECGVKYFP